MFSILLFVSMWSDSTLGTQGGISFFMVFTTLFLVRPNDPVFVQQESEMRQAELKAEGLR